MKATIKSAAALAALGFSLSATAGVIDTFSTSQAQIVDTVAGVGPVVTSTAGANGDTTILGGWRDLVVDNITDPFNADGGTRIGVSGGVLSFSNDSLHSGTGTVQWDGNADNATPNVLDKTGLGGTDITDAGGTIGFNVLTIKSDGGYQFRVGAYTSATQYTEITLVGSVVPFTPAGVASFIPFAGFSACGYSDALVVSVVCGGGGAVDFTNLGALEVVFDPLGTSLDLDVTIDLVSTVPEPSVLALLGASLLGLGAFRRGRKSA